MSRKTIGAMVLLPLLIGCAHYQDPYARGPETWWDVNVGAANRPSRRTHDTLREVDLDAQYSSDPVGARKALAEQFRTNPRRDWAYAIAEMSLLEGLRAEASRQPESADGYYRCVQYSYAYLFAPEISEPINPLDPRTRLACDLYNSAVARMVCLAQTRRSFDPQKRFVLPMSGGTLDCPVVHQGFPWRADEFDDLVPTEQASSGELGRDVRAYGLGVPMVGVRKRPENCESQEKYLTDCHPFAVTVVLRPETRQLFAPSVKPGNDGPVDLCMVADRIQRSLAHQHDGLHVEAEGEAPPPAGPTVELLDPLNVPVLKIANRTIGVEAELSSPIIYTLRRVPRKTIELLGFLDPGRAEKDSGLVMLQPYQKGKIPIVFVHGLLSDPLTWTEMFNELGADPEIRRKYQFWAFFYPTGNPFLKSAATLRRDLAEVRRACDPNGDDAALSQMVLVGHSMGGLLSKLQVTASGDRFWDEFSKKPLSQIRTDDETRSKLQRVFYFEPQPFVRRVVYIGTPHGGSSWSPALVGRVSSWLVHMPKMLGDLRNKLIRDNPDTFQGAFGQKKLPTSIDMLAPDSPILQVMHQVDAPPIVTMHSIVGNSVNMGREGMGDGVVPVSSAHIDQASSEVLVAESHTNLHRHPRAVLEVKRILKEHWLAMRSPANLNRPIPAQALNQGEPALVLPAAR